MDRIFINDSHKTSYLGLVREAAINEYDIERKALFYIISGNDELYSKRYFIYDFSHNAILTDCIISGQVDFCSSSRSLIRLGYNLYNGYIDDYTSPLSLLCGLDSKNFFLAFHAILIRLKVKNHYLALACQGE